ncbi:MAG: hypothetical protein ACLFV7_11770 [Phycisphaerae bacterium]
MTDRTTETSPDPTAVLPDGRPPGEADLAGPFRADAVPAEETDLDPRKP